MPFKGSCLSGPPLSQGPCPSKLTLRAGCQGETDAAGRSSASWDEQDSEGQREDEGTSGKGKREGGAHQAQSHPAQVWGGGQ